MRNDKYVFTIRWMVSDFVDAACRAYCYIHNIEEWELTNNQRKKIAAVVKEALETKSNNLELDGLEEAMISEGNDRLFWLMYEFMPSSILNDEGNKNEG